MNLPDIELKNQNAENIRLHDYLNKRNLVIFFYPKDETPICTKEACSFRNAYDDFLNLDAEVIGISSDSEASHLKFKERYKLPFPLLSDPKGLARSAFGLAKFLGIHPPRVSFVFDKNGLLKRKISGQFRSRYHVEEALKELSENDASN